MYCAMGHEWAMNDTANCPHCDLYGHFDKRDAEEELKTDHHSTLLVRHCA